jgi:DNA polymerase V
LAHSLDAIRYRYGKNSVLRCSSLLSASTIKIRHEQIGGHKQ